MKKILFILTILLVSAQANAACDIKATEDDENGKVYFPKDHRLYKHAKMNIKKFCSSEEAENAGYDLAPDHFANSTANLVNCVKDGDSSCTTYVSGIYRSLSIYEETCGNAGSGEVLDKYVEIAGQEKNLDQDKYSGAVAALKQAFPCGRKRS